MFSTHYIAEEKCDQETNKEKHKFEQSVPWKNTSKYYTISSSIKAGDKKKLSKGAFSPGRMWELDCKMGESKIHRVHYRRLAENVF